MTRLPVMSGRQVVRTFEHLGWRVLRHHGSHAIMVKAGNDATLTIPDHPEVAVGLLHALLHAAGIDVADFEAAAAGHHGEGRERRRETGERRLGGAGAG